MDRLDFLLLDSPDYLICGKVFYNSVYIYLSFIIPNLSVKMG